MSKIINTRIAQKHDVEAVWHSAECNVIPYKGELIIYDPDDTHANPRLKIGDGKQIPKHLPFIKSQWRIESNILFDGGTATTSDIYVEPDVVENVEIKWSVHSYSTDNYHEAIEATCYAVLYRNGAVVKTVYPERVRTIIAADIEEVPCDSTIELHREAVFNDTDFIRVHGTEISTLYFEVLGQQHSYTETVVSATCTEDGYTEYVCDWCGASYSEAGEKATGHDWDEESATYTDEGEEHCTSVTCKTCGAVDSWQEGHAFAPDTINGGVICTLCGHHEYL